MDWTPVSRKAAAIAIDVGGLLATLARNATADVKADQRWIERLEDAFPGDRIITEETFQEQQLAWARQRGRVWFVDPLDGTSTFLRGEDSWSTMAALVVDGMVQLGVVHRPSTGETYTAVRGGGAFLNSSRLHVSATASLANLRLVRRHTLSNHLEQIVQALPCKEISVSGSLGLKLCLVAQGRFDLTVYDSEPNLWDLLPGRIILEEAGGKVTDLFGKDIPLTSVKAQGILATNGVLHQQALARIQPLSVIYTRHAKTWC